MICVHLSWPSSIRLHALFFVVPSWPHHLESPVLFSYNLACVLHHPLSAHNILLSCPPFTRPSTVDMASTPGISPPSTLLNMCSSSLLITRLYHLNGSLSFSWTLATLNVGILLLSHESQYVVINLLFR